MNKQHLLYLPLYLNSTQLKRSFSPTAFLIVELPLVTTLNTLGFSKSQPFNTFFFIDFYCYAWAYSLAQTVFDLMSS